MTLEFANAHIVGEFRKDIQIVYKALQRYRQFNISRPYRVDTQDVRQIERAFGDPDIAKAVQGVDLRWSPGKRWVVKITGVSTSVRQNVLEVINETLDTLRDKGEIIGLCLPYVFDQMHGEREIDSHLKLMGMKRVLSPLGGAKKVVPTFTARELKLGAHARNRPKSPDSDRRKN